MSQPFQLAACAEMLWPDKPMDWRAARLTEMGFGVGLWNWPDWDLGKLERVGANYTIMNGYLQGRLADQEGADMLLRSARETAQIGKRLGVDRLNLHGTGLGDGGIPIRQYEVVTGDMWLKARDTLQRICDLAEQEDVVFTLENLNPLDHPGCPFGSTGDVLALVSSVNHSHLRINLDLYHTQIGEGDLVRWCKKCLPWIGEVQVADNPGRCEPGTGEINYAAVARALDDMGYRGPVGLEAFAAGDPETALEAFRAAFTI
ncbi:MULTISPECIES: TIM barrel protein [unclassified Ruegeria]|uniref:TIM barrel protein n=1 Tax=unclassified Ruegeria TaxID=2625375 RepID=UPI0014877DEA|nr:MULTISPECIES: TIM barrel protein [unclassified Ruegeria]NOD36789.1 TIM barrel protein [Ruegeria sp. HKCCD7296]NOD47844.1 TIM barrel protein [Ruegeria sp. HKCCD5849]NOD52828.1 TIM barrel protein [Ruegeria sp. HKCCD5851]NOD68974.1 TIM barrel protein [Ruegeria sp. HKCCD7303]NOE35329.1 TIM barrel protein [Ruegeria sp. HKCCD7318]